MKSYNESRFQESDDFVLTASVLKCTTSNDILTFDGSGKIFGISQRLFKVFQQLNPSLTLETLMEGGFI
jgi:hypothetical protein